MKVFLVYEVTLEDNYLVAIYSTEKYAEEAISFAKRSAPRTKWIIVPYGVDDNYMEVYLADNKEEHDELVRKSK